jgi:hypothetical protein
MHLLSNNPDQSCIPAIEKIEITRKNKAKAASKGFIDETKAMKINLSPFKLLILLKGRKTRKVLRT